MSELKIGVSPLTGDIYIGTVSKRGLWGKNKTESTEQAVGAVFEKMMRESKLAEGKNIEYSYQGFGTMIFKPAKTETN